MLMQNFGVTNKEHYGMLWYFLEWSIVFLFPLFQTRTLLYPLMYLSCLWIGIRTNKFGNCLKRVLKDARAGVLSSFDKWHSTINVLESSQWIFFIRNITYIRKRKHPPTWTSIDLQSRNSSWAIEIVTFASLLMNARRDARLNTTTSETGNTGNTKWRRD